MDKRKHPIQHLALEDLTQHCENKNINELHPKCKKKRLPKEKKRKRRKKKKKNYLVTAFPYADVISPDHPQSPYFNGLSPNHTVTTVSFIHTLQVTQVQMYLIIKESITSTTCPTCLPFSMIFRNTLLCLILILVMIMTL